MSPTVKPSHFLSGRHTGFDEAWQRVSWAWPSWYVWPALWLLVLIVTPISLWTHGDTAFPLMTTLGVVAHVFATLTAVAGSWPVVRLAAGGALIVAGAWVVEALGVATGLPFGDYHYTDALQPQLGSVPVIIPLAWFMMLLPAWAVADAILDGTGIKNHPRRVGRLTHAAVTGLAFTAWDLYLDPQMVARSLWVWEKSGGYFGVPLTNFGGWWLAATLLILIVGRVFPAPVAPAVRLRLVIIYTLMWAFQVVGLGLFWGQPGPALVGFIGMGVFVVAGWLRELQLWT
ncbi:MAG: carotenoid biosynthesis protein [Anaerolineae bacterium]